jgi:hypothetical protein
MNKPGSTAQEKGAVGWLNWRAERSGAAANEGAIEFAIFSDAHLTEGNFELGPYELINAVGSSGPIGNVQLGLMLRVRDHLPDERRQYDWSRTDTTHYRGGGIAEEFAALVGCAYSIFPANRSDRYAADQSLRRTEFSAPTGDV